MSLLAQLDRRGVKPNMLRSIVPARQKGFTLIELLVVIGIIGILAAVVLVAVNPRRQFASARDTQRRADLYSLTNAIYQFATENNGSLPTAITTQPTCIGSGGGCLNFADPLDPDNLLVPTYIAQMPIDPSPTCTEANTCYYVNLDNSGRIVATAASELNQGVVITVQR